jgi:hypothetical protein
MKPLYKYFSVIRFGDLLDSVDKDGNTIRAESRVDSEATHRERDRELIRKMGVYGEVLKAGLVDNRTIGEQMIEMAKEAKAIEDEVGFYYGEG